MKKVIVACLPLLFVLAASPADAQCTKIASGAILDKAGAQLTLGFDQWGYNYQAHMFNGLTTNYTRPADVATDGPENLVMKWSDEWLANVDCNHDGLLDRGLNKTTGDVADVSKGWVTNHYEGDYEDGGEIYHYTYFAKIVYDGGTACLASQDSCLWGLYTIIEEVYNDPHAGFHGNDRSKLVNPAGLGIVR